ncbi:uncharacterized protein LOC116425392 [Nomia melanderi]|uniref:uncharacterized protein LOC116425392 n=1 Tax=Nomia melanderi TaxID=2448451 RepID=UPI001304025A|nr:uncharacterized protein LOC116425392 [Nomia melanderi]
MSEIDNTIEIMSTEPEENVETPHEEVQNPTDKINFLMEQLSELNDMISAYKQNRDDWESYLSTFQISNWTKQVKHNELKKRENHLRKTISETMRMTDNVEQELKNLISQKIGADFGKKCSNYTENFLCAYTKYSSEKLSKDIEWYKHQCEKIYCGLPTLIKEVENLEVQHGLDSCISDGHTEKTLEMFALSNNIIISYNNNKIQKIEAAQQTLEKLEDKLNCKSTRL